MLKIDLKLEGRQVYFDPTTSKVRIGYRGVRVDIEFALRCLEKSDRRQLRKALRRAGYAGAAGIPINRPTVLRGGMGA